MPWDYAQDLGLWVRLDSVCRSEGAYIVNLPIFRDRLILCPKIRGKGGTMATVTVIINIRDILGYDFGNFEVPEDNFWDNYEKILFSLGEDMDSTVFDIVKGGE